MYGITGVTIPSCAAVSNQDLSHAAEVKRGVVVARSAASQEGLLLLKSAIAVAETNARPPLLS